MSPRRRQLLMFVHDQVSTTGVVPTMQEMGDALGITTSSVRELLDRLEADGHVRRPLGRNRPRSLQVVRLPGRGLLAAEAAWCHANPERVRAMMAVAGASLGAGAGA